MLWTKFSINYYNIPGVGLGQSAGEGVIDTEGVAPTVTVLVTSSVELVHTHLDDDVGVGDVCRETDGAVLVANIVPPVTSITCTWRMLNSLYRFELPGVLSRGSASHWIGLPSRRAVTRSLSLSVPISLESLQLLVVSIPASVIPICSNALSNPCSDSLVLSMSRSSPTRHEISECVHGNVQEYSAQLPSITSPTGATSVRAI